MTRCYKIAVVGLWHLGEIYSVGLAELGHTVMGVSDDEKVVVNFSRGIPVLPEPLLEGLLRRNLRVGRLRYTSDFSGIKESNVLWITFDTPVDDNDEVDLSPIWQALEKSVPYLQKGILIIVTSQIPLGTSKKIKQFISRRRPELKFDYVYTPENLRLGEAVRCFFRPGRIVVGADSKAAFKKMKGIFSGVQAEILQMLPESAEVSKHALNALLATSISFINDIADVCERSDADVSDVVHALRSDFRIGPGIPLGAGLGFSGGTLGRDLKALLKFSKDRDLFLPVIDSVFKKNKRRRSLVLSRLRHELRDLNKKTISIFGLTYKPGTRTLRRSRALEIAADLSRSGVTLRLTDPVVLREELPVIKNSDFFSDPYGAAADSNAIVLITPWPEFRKLDFKKLFAQVRPRGLFYDTSNFLADKAREIESYGIKYIGVGR